MKVILATFSILFLSSFFYAQNGVLSQPEMAIMYMGYNNKIVPMLPNNEQIILELEGGSATATTWTDALGSSFKGYYIKPSTSQYVTIHLKGKTEKGIINDRGTFIYKVKAFPAPMLEQTSISKSSGMSAVISLGADSPFTGISYSIIGGTLTIDGKDPIKFNGHQIPSSLLNDAAIGSNVLVELSYKSTGQSSGTYMISSALKVVP
jgi:hypothetical protein